MGERKIAYCDLLVFEKLTASLNKYRIVFTKALADFFTFGCPYHVDCACSKPILNISLTISKHKEPLSAFIA